MFLRRISIVYVDGTKLTHYMLMGKLLTYRW